MVRKLLSAGATPGAKNEAGLDAGSFAAMFGRSDVAAILTANAEKGPQAP